MDLDQSIIMAYSTKMKHSSKHDAHQRTPRSSSTNSNHIIGIDTLDIVLQLIFLSILAQQQIINNKNMSTKNQQKQITKTKKIVKQNKSVHQPTNKTINNKAIAQDTRFSAAHYDPKFAPVKLNLGKVKIDKRFADKLDSQKFKIAGSTDKYGRKNIDNSELAGMGDYYYTQDEPQSQQKGAKQRNKSSNKQKINQKKANIKQNEQESEMEAENSSRQHNQNNISKWMKQYDEQSSSDDMEEELVEENDSVWSDDDKNVIKNENVQITNRLALCNYDWMNISSKDLMILFSSFKPTSGTILSVTVYYSQLGKQKMSTEQKYGPQGIWNEVKQDNQQQEQNDRRNKLSQLPKSKRQEEAFNHKKLRAYEKERLKFCYAIIQCNSKKTADQIYKQCDGNQFQNSNTLFDLRFVPDSIQFDQSMLKQKCSEIPVSGEVKNFVSRALGHSKVSLTWQDPELNSIASLKKRNWSKMSDKEMDTIDWGLYLNQDVEQANDNLNKILKKDKKQRGTQKIQQIEVKAKNNDWRSQCNKKYKKNKQDDLQITFPSGFDKMIEKNQQKQSLNKQLKTRKERWRQNQEQKKSRQQIQLLVETSDKKQFEYNPNDQRFKAVLQNPQYYIDPSNPKFDHRKTGAVFQQVVKHNKKKNLL